MHIALYYTTLLASRVELNERNKIQFAKQICRSLELEYLSCVLGKPNKISNALFV